MTNYANSPRAGYKERPKPKLWRGLLAGALGGLIASGVKALAEIVFPARPPLANPPPGVLLDKLSMICTGHPLAAHTLKVGIEVFHYTFGTMAGAVYGFLAEIYPLVRIGWGVGFGLVLLLSTHETVIPLLGASAAPWRLPLQEQLSELVTHGIFGATVETVRRWFRRS